MKKNSIKKYLFSFLFSFSFFPNQKIFSENKEDSEIEDRKKRLEEIQVQIQAIEEDILKISQNKSSVQDEISILEKSISKTNLDISAIEDSIVLKNLEISDLQKEIDVKNLEIDSKKGFLNEVAYEFLKISKPTTLDILLGEKSLSDYLRSSQNLKILQEKLVLMLDALRSEREDLKSKQRNLKIEIDNLNNLTEQQKELLFTLEQQNSSKKMILQDLAGSESEYQKLLAESRIDYENLRVEILQLEESRLSKNETENSGTRDIDISISWPCDSRKITAYFLDEDYKKYFGVNHYAIDISLTQGSPVYAVADGKVSKVRDAGMGYNYLMIQYDDQVSSVYGHVSKFKVSEGEKVTKGQVVALSGGAPGTPGAGRMTTGAHLHFELIVDGKHVNPLVYLPT